MAKRNIKAELAASVLEVKVSVGDRVAAGDTVASLESMKMEIPVITPFAGVISAILIEKDAVVEEGDVLLEVDA